MAKRIPIDPADQFKKCTRKRVRVIAGPGTGKSYCLKERILHHIKDEGIAPEKILVLTFTSVAVQDLRNDIKELSRKKPGLHLEDVVVSTLHGLALKQLGQEKKRARKMENFEVETMLRDLQPDFGKVGRKKELLRECINLAGGKAVEEDAEMFLKSLNDWQKQHHGMALEHVIPYICKYLTNNESARKRQCFDRVLVDEYQDLNPEEQQYVELLTAKSGKLAIIGDDDQSIYEFKGASPDGIRNYTIKHVTCKDIRFTVCRRCPSDIVDMAKRLIIHNKKRIQKTFVSFPQNQKGIYLPLTADTPEEEIDQLCSVIKAERKDPNLKTIVVLAPTKDRGSKLYTKLYDEGIPVEFCYRGCMLDNKTICDCLAFLMLAYVPNDTISWRYLLGRGKQDRYATVYKNIRDIAKKEKKEIVELLEECASGSRQIPYTNKLIDQYKNIKNDLEEIKKDPYKIISRFNKEEQLYATVVKQIIDAQYKTEGFYGVRRAMLEIAYSPENAAASDSIRIMSLHAAKGLSAQMVIIMSAVEGMIPRKGISTIEEQRRLFYVGITRCKGGETGKYPGKLIISSYEHSDDGTKNYDPSRFIQEMM